MNAYHIIGLTARELGGFLSYGEDASTQARARYEQICRKGHILPRCALPGIGGLDRPDRSTAEDDIAGDDRYVFLSVGQRYSVGDLAPIAFGFIFEAERLIHAGAFLNKYDLAADYMDIVGEVAEEVAATLPRLARMSDEEADEFMVLMEEGDPGLREAILNGSTDPEYDLTTAIHARDLTAPGCAQATALIQERMAKLHAQARLRGQAALDYLRNYQEDGHMELLWEGPLDVAAAHGRIEGGNHCTG